MATGFQPVGAALPPRRDSLSKVAAADAVPVASGNDWGSSINVPLARDRMLEYFEREQLPNDVRSTLAAALNGDLHYQHLLFTAMMDTWPKLQKGINEIARKVSVAPWKIIPYAERGEKPDPKAEKIAKEIESIVWGMKPRVERMESGLEDTIKTLVRGYYYGHAVCEIRWENKDGWRPRATKAIPARFYGYPYDAGTSDDPEDRLMFDPTGMMGGRSFVDFGPNRFLIAINAGHGGHPSMAAPLRSLAGYWLAAVYGLKWFMNFTQLYGIPWRHAKVGDTKDENSVKQALASIGSTGYIVTKSNTVIDILDAPSTGGQNLPQKALIDLADQQCDQFILGQTLTSGVSSDGGSRALGEVHKDTLDQVVDGVADFVGAVLTHQLIPAIVAVNYGDSVKGLPEMWAKREEVKDEKALAERDEKIGITSGKVKVSETWFYERHGIPMPAESDKLLIEEAEEPEEPDEPTLGPDGKPMTVDPPSETKAVPKKSVEAADAGEWVSFDNSLGIPRREMPQISSGNRAAMVSFLRARGIESKREEVMAKHLLPTQAEYSPAKVQAAREYQGGNRAILVSEEGRLVDGHHQWKAALDDGKRVEVIRLMAPISRVLMMAHRMPSTSVAAADATEALTIDDLSSAVLEGLTGVATDWLSPVKPFFDRLAALAMSKQVTDEDFIAALEKAQTELPELFDILNVEALETAFMNAISSAALSGSVEKP